MSEPTIQERIARAIDEIADHLRSFADEHPPDSRTRLQAEASIYTHRKCAEIARETSGWIAVAERVPEEDGEFVIAWCDWPGGRPPMPWPARYIRGEFYDYAYGEMLSGVAYWRPMTEPPPGGDAT